MLELLLVICCALQFVFVPWFLKVMWPNPNKKSLLLKMICASLFVATGVLSMYIASNFTTFAIIMLVGLVFGWLGDFFLHVNTTKTCFGIGFTSFLIGHIVYIVAYCKTLTRIVPDYNQFNFLELAVVVALVVLALVGWVKFKIRISPAIFRVCIFMYFVVLAFMFVKATSLGYNNMLSGAPYGWAGLLTLGSGSFLFMVSDVLIGVIMFGGQKKNYPLKIVNIATYFAAQVLLAVSILFVRG